MYDLLLKNGTICDGTGAAPYVPDIGTDRGRIAALGALDPDAIGAAQTVYVAGLAVSREVSRQVLERIAGLHPAPG